MSDERPTVIVVTGYPASGKSSLARRLSKRLGIAFFTKDAIKERLFEELPKGNSSEREHSQALSRASVALLLDVVPPLLRAGESVILEANFKRERDSRALREACQIRSRIVQIVCECPPKLLQRRFRDRIARGGRHGAHDDEAYLREFDALVGGAPCTALDIRGAVIEVDTSRFSEALVDEVAQRVRVAIDSQR